MNRSVVSSESYQQKRGLGRVAAFFTALFTAFMMTIGTFPAAMAAEGEVVAEGVTASITLNGDTWNGKDVVREGDILTLAVQYGQDTVPGSTVQIKLSENAEFSTNFPNNEAIESVEVDDTEPSIIRIKFVDNLGSINQGMFELDFQMTAVEGEPEQELEWEIGDQKTTLEIIVVQDDYEFGPQEAAITKSVKHEKTAKFKIEGDEVIVENKAELLAQTSTFTIVASVNAAGTIDIADVMPAELALVSSSITAHIKEWDQTGTTVVRDADDVTSEFSAQITTDGDGVTSFTGSVTTEGPAILTVTYDAQLTQDGLNSIIAALQGQLAPLGDNAGTLTTTIINTATLVGTEVDDAEAKITFSVAKTGSNPGAAFAKTFTNDQIFIGDENGQPLETVHVTAQLKADLTKFKPVAIAQKVVINDTLPDGVVWNTTDPNFITETSGDLQLSNNTSVCENAGFDAENFHSSSALGDWCVDGQTLLINVGKNNEESYTINAKAIVTDLAEAARKEESRDPAGTKVYSIRNTAKFTYGDGDLFKDRYDDVKITVLPVPGDDGVNDSATFVKEGRVENSAVNPGDTTKVWYKFELAAGVADIDITQSSVVDFIDTTKFQLPADANDIPISGTYDSVTLDPTDFDLSYDGENNIEIKLSDSGVAKVNDEGLGKKWSFEIELETIPFVGKETFTLTNKATLRGSSGENLYWSSTESESTSYGNEAEVRKRVYDSRAGEGQNPWSEEVNALVGEDGFFENPFIYRIEFIPHGNYNNLVITEVEDYLPAGIEFIGFIDASEVGADDVEDLVQQGPLDIGGNLQVEYKDDEKLVVINQKNGTKLDKFDNPRPTAYFVVRADSNKKVIVNSIGGSDATIKSVTAEVQWNKVGDDGQFLGGSEWLLEGPDGYSKTIVDNGSFDDNKADGEFTVSHLNYGDYKLTETAAPAGHLLDAEEFKFSIAEGEIVDGELIVKLGDFLNNAKTYAIGDYVWIDTNRDGLQDSGEEVLEGVKVELFDEDENLLQTTATDANGRYIFDQLLAGNYRVKFTLTEEQAKIYDFTKQNAEGSNELDSDADVVTGMTELITLNDSNEYLTNDYLDQEFLATQGIDPTWDAGVIRKAVSVGDYVWLDKNRDGIQDKNEPGIEDVVLCLIGPDGESVTDVYGNPVGPVKTDKDGYYIFENLPALQDDETYTVCIDRESSEQALKGLTPTIENAGDDRAKDSSTWFSVTIPGDLHNDGDHDPTLDFGFYLKSYAVGDYVWIDDNKDGLQDKTEKPLEGVKVEIFAQDGSAVQDVYGKKVKATSTDANGWYMFDNLPAGIYQVKFTLTKKQAAIYEFTKAEAGTDSAIDSNADLKTGFTTWFVLDDSNPNLTDEYRVEFEASEGIDPTWDAGVILIESGAIDATLDDKDTPNILERTGGALPIIGLASGALLLAAGVTIFVRNRRLQV